MAQDVFGRLPQDFGGAFAADAAVATFSLGPGVQGGVGLLTQTLQVQYQQRITRIYEIGSRATFYVAGRSQGQGAISRILGPRPVTLAFYRLYGNVCRANQNTLLFQVAQGCNVPADANAGVAFAMLGVILNSLQMQVQAQQMTVNEQLQMMFVAMIA